MTAEATLKAVAHCEHCHDPVYGPHAETMPPAHPCCAHWIGELGYSRCYSCHPCAPAQRVPDAPPERATTARAA